MARSFPALTLLALLLAAPAAHGHSLVRKEGTDLAYISSDAVSLNTLIVKRSGANIEFSDRAVEGGLDPGPCTPGAVTDDANAWLVQVFCPAAGASRVRIDLGDREDALTAEVDISLAVLGGTGADRLTAAGAADSLAGGDGDDVIRAGGGNDLINGGDGDDEVDAGAGDDIVEAGLGVDSIAGGDGVDDLRVRDGVADTVRCGAGGDKVDADTLDEIALDCEDVRRLPTPVPELGGTTGRDRVKPQVRVGGSRVQRGTRVKLFATSSERGTLSASGFVEIGDLALPISAKPRRVGVGGGGAELVARLDARQRREATRAWRRGGKVTVRLAVVGTDRAGNSKRVRAPAIRLRR